MDSERKGFSAGDDKCGQVIQEEMPDAVRRLKATFRNKGTSDAKKKGESLQLHPTDIVIAAPRKNGTTWMKQVNPFDANQPYAKGDFYRLRMDCVPMGTWISKKYSW